MAFPKSGPRLPGNNPGSLDIRPATRILLNLIVILALLPVVAIVAPEVFDAIWPWGDGGSPQSASAADRLEPGLSPQAGLGEESTAELNCSSPPCSSPDDESSALAASSEELEGSSSDHDHATSSTDGASTTQQDSAGTDDSTTTAPTTSTTAPTTSTTAPTTSTTQHSDTVVDGTITGNACPCTVTSTVELKGKINLQGDLMVDGGTLVARPGVDLNGNGFQIMFMHGGKADFRGTKVFTWSGNGGNQNLTRDINFRNLRRIMFHLGAGPSVIKYVTVSDSGTPELGDYPLHWHLNGNSTRGTIVEGVVVVNGRHHAFVPHGSHGITFKDTIAKNTSGPAYWWDRPGTNESCSPRECTLDNSNDIVYDHALADGVTNGPGDDRGFNLSAFVLQGGSGNVVRNSVGKNVMPSHIKNCSAFYWPEHASQVWVFENNRGSSACHGIRVWQNGSNHHIIDGFSGGGIDHGAYGNSYDYRRVSVPYIRIHAVGWVASDSSLGEIILLPHVGEGKVVFTNVTGTRIVVRDAPSSSTADEPITLEINGTNLTCADVDWVDPHPETQVVIDGSSC